MLREFDHSNMLHQEFTQSAPLVAELSAYLRKPRLIYQTENHNFERIEHMNDFPILKQLYLKYNCISASEADVERVFSYAGSLNLLYVLVLCRLIFIRHLFLLNKIESNQCFLFYGDG